MTLSAVDCISRGLVNLRANWELILFQMLQIFLVTVLTLVGFVPPLAVLGWTELEALDASMENWYGVVEDLSGLLARGQEAWLMLLASLLLSSAIWLMAMLVYCYFQGGIYGCLMAGDRQAPPGKAQGHRWFRTFSVRDLRGWAARYLWRYFWLLNLFLSISMGWLLIPLVLILLVVWGEAQWGAPAAVGIGCGGAIPVAFSIFVLTFWVSLAQADLAREDSGVWIATRRALRILGRRLGAIIVLTVVLIVVAASLGIMMGVASTFFGLFSGTGTAAQVGGQLALTLVEWIISGTLSVAIIAILISLVHSETPHGVTA